jgi:hypothetical protein
VFEAQCSKISCTDPALEGGFFFDATTRQFTIAFRERFIPVQWSTDDETSCELSVGRPSGSAEDHIRTLVLRQNSDADVPGCNADDEGGEMIAA